MFYLVEMYILLSLIFQFIPHYFRHCNHVLSKELDKFATNLLQDLVRFQDNKFAEDPVKAKARRRYVVGLREATKYMKVSDD